MRKLFVVIIAAGLGLLCGCNYAEAKAEQTSTVTTPAASEYIEDSLPYMLKFNDRMYSISGIGKSYEDAELTEENYLGRIESEVEPNQSPSENNQTNIPWKGAEIYAYGDKLLLVKYYDNEGNPTDEPIMAVSETEISISPLDEKPPMVYLSGSLYRWSGTVSAAETDLSEEMLIGTVKTVLCRSEIPKEELEANFSSQDAEVYTYGEDMLVIDDRSGELMICKKRKPEAE